MSQHVQASLDLFTERGIAWTSFPSGAVVYTMRLEVDHGLPGKPKWYETMIYGGRLRGRQWRYETEREARAGHDEAVSLVEVSEETSK